MERGPDQRHHLRTPWATDDSKATSLDEYSEGGSAPRGERRPRTDLWATNRKNQLWKLRNTASKEEGAAVRRQQGK